MQKRHRKWYRVTIVCWLLMMITINILNFVMLHTSAYASIERSAIILLVGIFSLYSINYYFSDL